MSGHQDEPVVTTSMLTTAEQAAWQVAVDRGLPVGAADLRALLAAAEPLTAAAEREACARLVEGFGYFADLIRARSQP